MQFATNNVKVGVRRPKFDQKKEHYKKCKILHPGNDIMTAVVIR